MEYDERAGRVNPKQNARVCGGADEAQAAEALQSIGRLDEQVVLVGSNRRAHTLQVVEPRTESNPFRISVF